MSSTMLERPASELSLSPLIAQALDFTETYKRYIDAPIAIREAMCLKAQYPALMGQIRHGDMFAGRKATARLTYLGTIWWAGTPARADGRFHETKQGGYCFDFALASSIGETEEEKRVVAELVEFWREHYTLGKVTAAYDDEIRAYGRGNGQVGSGANGFCVTINSDRLLQRGLPGLMEDVKLRRERALKAGEDASLFDGFAIALEVVIDVAHHYRRQALEMAQQTPDAAEQARLREVADTLQAITEHAPRTLREAIQLFWLYTHLVGGNHPESFRLDVSLGDFLARDIDSGLITEEQAIEMVQSLWRMINENGADAVCRVVVGGKGRRNPKNADRFVMIAMEATRRHRRVTPQLTYRFDKDHDPRLMRKAFDVLGEGCCFPMLYNDDVCVPGAARSMHLPMEDAHLYYPLGCGEYMVGWASPSVLCCSWSIPKSLDAALHDGYSGGILAGPRTGSIEQFDSFEKLYAAFLRQVEFAAIIAAKAYRCVFDVTPQDCCFLLASLLTDDCLENGKGVLEGSRYLGACTMGHGFTNAADSLAAIRKLVYQEKKLTLKQLVEALDANFEGYEEIQKLLQAAPKFGNDIDEVDELLVDIYRQTNAAADRAGRQVGLGFHTVSSINPGGYGMGAACGATADGRKKGEPFAIGHAPTAGKDTSGLTALFNSVAKIDPANGGAVTNFKISREMFTSSREKLQAMFDVYFDMGGMEATLTVVNRNDLQAAMKEPEKYTHILVRLGGWCARFVDLDRTVQEEIIRRTLY